MTQQIYSYGRKTISEKESLQLISMMINKAKNAYRDTGVSAIMWGIVITICSLVKFSEFHFKFELPFDIYWLTMAAVIPQIIISIREKKARKVKAYDDVYMDFLWISFGISIFLMSFIINVIAHNWEPVAIEYEKLAGHSSRFVFGEFITPFFLLLYGIPTLVTGATYKFKPMIFGAVLCWVSCIITLYTSIKIDLLLTALSALMAWLIPGIIIEKNYRKAKRELAEGNV